jgi:hypothetical protein
VVSLAERGTTATIRAVKPIAPIAPVAVSVAVPVAAAALVVTQASAAGYAFGPNLLLRLLQALGLAAKGQPQGMIFNSLTQI